MFYFIIIIIFIFYFFLGGAKGAATFIWGRQEDGIAMIFFPHHIYCAQSQVKWGGGGQWGPWSEWGGGHGTPRHAIVTPLAVRHSLIVLDRITHEYTT